MHIVSIFGLKATREEYGDGYWYQVEDFFSLNADSGEKAMIEELDALLSTPDDYSLPPFVVGFKSSNFDLPLLKLRAMRHRIALACLGEPGEDRYGRGRGRLSQRFHFDLAQEILGYRNAPLDAVCDLLAIPLRFQRTHEYEEAKTAHMRNTREWAELTVLIQWAIFLQWSLVINELNTKTFELSIESFCEFLQGAAETRPHFERWLGAYFASAELERSPFFAPQRARS